MAVEILRITYSLTEYVKDFRNYVEVVLYTSCVLFVFNFLNQCGCPKDWQWQIGIFVVFLGWINLIFFASRFPKTGLYVLVFKEILFTFLKLILFSILLVLAFSLILFMMFNSPTATVSNLYTVSTLNLIKGVFKLEMCFQYS